MRQLFVGGRRAAAAAAFAAVVAAGVTAPGATALAAPHAASSVTLAASTTARPHVTSSPKSVVVVTGHKATFRVKTSGVGLTYRWYVSTNGKTWKKIAKATHTSYTVKAKASVDGHRYRVVVRNAHGSVTSKSAKLTVALKPHVTRQPHAATVVSGKKATFSVRATGNALGYQWYGAAPGKSYAKVSGATKATYAFTTSAAKNGYRYKVSVRNKAGHVTSASAKLTVITKPKITKQPVEELDVASGATVKLRVQASGIGLTYQWQYADLTDDGDDVVYRSIKGATGSSFSFTAKTTSYDDLRVVVSNKAGKVASDDSYITVGSSPTDPYGPDNGGFLTSWAVGLDTDAVGGATTVVGDDTSAKVTSRFLGLALDPHADETLDLAAWLVVEGVAYPATVTPKALQYDGFYQFTLVASPTVSKADAAKGIWKITDSSGAKPVTQYFTQG
ncbi:hypothetical protein GCM10025864_28920 [Luteimicrobium album]|uniref:Immunoglobulin domain-containing protein n=1 Tax=Luteimicrobium album TaxID=1054550 RepID=A0ABQ6I578_9MICO|nr:hypothetical protein [Luteimicrobium album]GMA25133.1 hypothetical protein GCM10025864_28920 [Luteimicrobium album]